MVGGEVLYRQGAYAQAIALFRQVAGSAPDEKAAAERWISYLEREIERSEVVRATLIDLAR